MKQNSDLNGTFNYNDNYHTLFWSFTIINLHKFVHIFIRNPPAMILVCIMQWLVLNNTNLTL